MYKSCSRCGRIHDSNFQCTKNKVYKRTKERKLRSRYVWSLKSQEIREKAKDIVAIPMRGKIESLNAAISIGIAMYVIQ